MPSSPQTLAGLRVVEAGTFIAAPLSAALLADAGAEVIKVEPPGGDPGRLIGPGSERRLASTFLASNRGKRSIVLDLRAEADLATMHQLIARADVFVHNLPTRAAARAGLDAASLPEGVISCRVSAFGDTGPLAGRSGLDPIVQAMAGISSVTGTDGEPPLRTPVPVVDIATALSAYGQIVEQLLRRERGLAPEPIELALYDVGLLLTSPLQALTSITGAPPPRRGNASYAILGDQFATADGFVTLVLWDDARWRALCELLGNPGLAQDARFASNELRLERHDDLRPMLAALIRPWSSATLEQALLQAGIPCGITQALDEIALHPAAQRLQYSEEGVEGPAPRLTEPPWLLGGRRARSPLPPPALGAHDTEIRAELSAAD
jgi:crotonobetainyl-CoA:carnitine CoA-transferase CaiB-like acyl-CoA transferase